MDINQQAFDRAGLIAKHLKGELTPTEEAVLARWLSEDLRNQQLFDALLHEENLQQELDFFSTLDTAEAWKKVAQQTGHTEPKVIKLWQHVSYWRRLAAAVLVLMAVSVTYLLIQHNRAAQKTVALRTEKTKTPSGDKAKITFEDGSVLALEDMKNGTAQERNGIRISKEAGTVIYQVLPQNDSDFRVAYNTISTPKGGQYQIELPDGSKVWLNAASNLRFPMAFTGSARQVQLTGEAYFEVAKNKKMPFKVEVTGMEIEVLGTHFNVMAYHNESAVRTTLLEGSVKVAKGADNALLKPGQQATLKYGAPGFIVAEADVADAVAWKNELFSFNNNDIHSVMREVARWYNVDIKYEGAMPKSHYTGMISRNITLAKVLDMLEQTGGVEFEVDGNKIIVTKKKSDESMNS